MLLIELIHAGRVVPGTREEIHDYLHQQNYVYLATIGQLETEKLRLLSIKMGEKVRIWKETEACHKGRGSFYLMGGGDRDFQ